MKMNSDEIELPFLYFDVPFFQKKTLVEKASAFQTRVLRLFIELFGSFALIVTVVGVKLIGMIVVIRLMRVVIWIILICVIVKL